jgi:transcriptional regulator GlxA family with amidase domain
MRVFLLVFPGFQLLDAAGPIAAFEAAQAYRVRTVAAQAGLMRSSSGLSVQAAGLPRLAAEDTLMVVGGPGVDAQLHEPALPAFLQRAAARGTRIASVCSGSLLLAAAGLLDGRVATTHWSRGEQFRRAFPQVRLDPDRIYTEDGGIWTSAGVTAGIDLSLALIARDHGQARARAVAKELVVYYRRPGGQSQFSELAAMQREDSRFDALLDHIRTNLRQRHRVESLAQQACMSPRHFARAFQQETGVTPAKAVERLRVEAARNALEAGAASVQSVARDCGFGNGERMRRSFLRVLGVPPSHARLQSAAH